MRMIGFLLFIAAANLAVSVFIKTPFKSKTGEFYYTKYTELSFKAVLVFGFLYIFS